MSYYVTNENSFLDIKNAHLRVTGNVHTDVLKLGAIEFQPTGSEVTGTVNFTNVTTGVTTSSNLSVGGTLQLGTVEVVATTHTLANTTALGNVTPHTIEVSNVTTGLVTTANVSVGRDLTVTGNVSVGKDLTVTGNVAVTGTGSLTVPSGTTAQRPATATNGMIRYNTTESKLETYTTDWLPLTIGSYTLYAFTSHTFIPPPHINISSMSSEPASWSGYADRRHVIAASGTWNAYTLDGIVSGGTHLGGFTTITDNGVTRSPTATEYNQGAGTWGYKLWVHWDGTTHQVLGLMRGREGDVRLGPTFAQLKSNYGASGWWQTPANLNEVSGKQGFQLWTAPTTGTYRITAKGAQGGSTAGNGTYSNSPGNGAHISADIALVKGTKIVIIVGQSGEYPTSSNKSNTAGGGGGATWILKENFTTANDQVYMVAGGGGGAGSPSYNVGQAGHANGASQGILGGGGAAAGTAAAGGAGWTGNGIASMSFGNGNSPGIRPAAGAMGGDYGYSNNGQNYKSPGGFGGGGGNGADNSGGGAGATGGAGSTSETTTSYGGTSYIITTATNSTFSGNHTDEDGSVYIQAPGQF